jgi:hypothetical protein
MVADRSDADCPELSHGTTFIPTHGFLIFSECKRETQFQELKYTDTAKHSI